MSTVLILDDLKTNNDMKLIKELWGKTPCGKDVCLYTLTNSKGAYVQLSELGAGVVSVVVPDKNGVLADVALGYAKAEDYLGDGPCMGKIPGRYANRVALGKFTLDGVEYTLVSCDYREFMPVKIAD